MMKNLAEARKTVEELRAELRTLNDELMGDKPRTKKEMQEMVERNNKLHSEYNKAYKMMKYLEAVEMEKIHGKQDEYIKEQLKANGIEVIKIKHWSSDPKPYVEISYKHRPQLGKLQDTIGDALGILFTIKV